MTNLDLEKRDIQKEQYEVDRMIYPMEEGYLRMFRFNWFEEAFFYILMGSVTVICWYGWMYQIFGHISWTLIGIATYVGCAAGAIFSLLNLLKYISNMRKMMQVRKETKLELAARKKRMQAYRARQN